MMPQTVPADYFCFTDNHKLKNLGNWMLDFTPYEKLGLSAVDTGNFRNSVGKNSHPYMRYKFIKTQFYHFPCLRGYEMIVWVDMTLRFLKPDMLERFWRIFQENPTKHIIVMDHRTPKTRSIKTEMEISEVEGRWSTTTLLGRYQPFQDVRGQYEYYIRDGYTEDYWKHEDLAYRNNQSLGLWQTNLMAFRMSDPLVPRFLDRWYLEILNWTTQCQVSFPYVVQKLRFYPYTLPTRA
jgi:hypothetical protein